METGTTNKTAVHRRGQGEPALHNWGNVLELLRSRSFHLSVKGTRATQPSEGRKQRAKYQQTSTSVNVSPTERKISLWHHHEGV